MAGHGDTACADDAYSDFLHDITSDVAAEGFHRDTVDLGAVVPDRAAVQCVETGNEVADGRLTRADEGAVALFKFLLYRSMRGLSIAGVEIKTYFTIYTFFVKNQKTSLQKGESVL